MQRTLRNLRRNRQESILESGELNSTADLDSAHRSGGIEPLDAEQRHSSEPTTVTRSSLYHAELSERPTPLQHQSTVGSSFSAFGNQLSRRNNDGQSSTQDEEGLSLVLDCNDPVADLIFVHGLGGSSRKTWSFERDVKNFWPPWLGSEVGFSNTRIFTFGYNGRFAGESTKLSILDFAKELLFQARHYAHAYKEDDVPIGTHPLIFVVHSMGGLVVKKAYIVGKTSDQFADMINQTYGIVFLGTPHRGANLASTLNNMLRASPSMSAKVYVDELEKGSTTISDINETFRSMCGDLALVSFYETLKTSIGVTKTLIVERDSAVLGYPGEISAPLRVDHHGLTKFKDREDVNYRDVRNVLRSFLRKIREFASTEKKLLKSTSPVPSAISLDQILGIKDIGDDLDTFRSRRHAHSCQWILRKPSFRDWTEEVHEDSLNLFWLSGPPAVGKTTLSAFITHYLKRGFVPGTCQYHFFQAEHHDTRTISYFLRSLAFQIAQEHEEFRIALASAYQKSGIPFASQKYQVIWDKVFEGILFRVKFNEPLFWVLDGLDEAESPGILCDLMTKITSATQIKVLLVSRPTKVLVSTLSSNGHLRREEIRVQDTADDIQSHVIETVSKIIPDHMKDQRTTVINNILSKAGGSFLWVTLAMERVKDSWYTPDAIHTALDGIPEGMDTMYIRMLEDVASLSDRNRKMAIEILTWTSCAFRPLDVEELAVALKDIFDFVNTQNLEAAIADICCNFISVKKSKVSLIHQTARTFLLTEKSELPISIDRGKSHEHIAMVCMKFLSNAPKWRGMFMLAQDTGSTSDQQSISHGPLNEPFLWYATTHWAYHVSCASADLGESETLQAAVFDFLSNYALLWMNAVALEGNLRILTRSAAYLKAWAKRKAHHTSQEVPTSLSLSQNSNGVDVLLGWSNDLIRVVGRFGAYLAENPSSIHKHVVPFCPHDSILYTTFQYQTGNGISVKGISSGKWDDCLARLTMGGDERGTKVVAKDNYFITLIGASGTLIIWHAETCEEARRLCHGEYVTAIKASKTSNLVATAGITVIRVWDIVGGEEIYNLPKTNQGRLMSLVFSSNDTELLIAYDDCTVQCIDLKSAKERWTFRAEDPSEPEHSCPRLMSFSQDSKKIAVAYRGRPVFVWKITEQRGQRPMRCIRREDRLKKHGDVWNAPEVVLWQPDSPNVLILYQDTKLVDWNLENNSQTEHTHLQAREMAVSSDGNLLLTSDNNGTLSVWTTGRFTLVYELAYDEFVRDIAFSPDGQRLYDVRGTLCNVWEPDVLIRSDDSNREDISTHDSTLYSVPVVSSDDNSRTQISALVCGESDQYFCTGKEDGTVVMFEMVNATQHRKLITHSTSVSVIEMAWSSRQKYFASADDSGRLIAKRLERPVNRTAKWKVFPLLDFRLGNAVTQLLFSSSEEFLLVSSSSLDRVYSTKTKEKLFQVSRPDDIPGRWVQHPTIPQLLIGIEGEKQALYRWSNLGKVDEDSPTTGNRRSQSVHDDESPNLEASLGSPGLSRTSSRCNETLNALEHVYMIQDRYLILEFLSNRHYTARMAPAASRHIDVIDLETLQRTNLPVLATVVNRLVGVTQEHLVFLNHQYWVCTWDISGGDKGEYTKHFFLPKDWLSPGARRLIILNRYGTLLCPKNGEVAIVREGIRI